MGPLDFCQIDIGDENFFAPGPRARDNPPIGRADKRLTGEDHPLFGTDTIA